MKPAAETVIRVFARVVVWLLPLRLVRKIQREMDDALFRAARRR